MNKPSVRTGVIGEVKDSQSRLLAVREHIKEETYKTHAVRRVYIEKDGSRGEKRPLGIPTVRDRVVQAAVKMVIEPIFEREFAPSRNRL